jgi:hypothetical protein
MRLALRRGTDTEPARSCFRVRLRQSGRALRPRSEGTTRERAVRTRADDRNRGRKRAQTGARGRTSLDRPERGRADPSPTGTSIPACAPCERTTGRRRPLPRNRAAPYRRHAGGHGRPQPAAGACRARRDDPIALPSTWVLPASPAWSREVRHAPVPSVNQNSRPRAPARRRGCCTKGSEKLWHLTGGRRIAIHRSDEVLVPLLGHLRPL